MASPYQQTNATIEKELAAKPTLKTAQKKPKVPRIDSKDLDELSKSWYPVQPPTRHIVNDKKPLFGNKSDEAKTKRIVGSKDTKISEDWELVEHEDADDHAELVSASGKVTKRTWTRKVHRQQPQPWLVVAFSTGA
ncbi:uncharacterized protein MYCGRDRAFT_92308 [Zymoseptoria tritici IPO323]|uniref:Uncharacterized protein n=1 Tax=Zymoseptoria tritici (strain CBS 115943 / IPO323) TaxID=336722 RepID=F9X8Q6_ZYMTI|nr:uncharacterized protein MYCGRDRAFT_92308 [Zymoseptoria tritici IPO323]EGP87821.1 hypothetical protein MYCGRDRAFT_92308 [Zymoseptoria tritici IPO323]